MAELFDVLDENGNFTGISKSRKECHTNGLWHKAVFLFVMDKDNKKVLLQLRAANKRMWPNLWDVTSGGHVSAGENVEEAIIRETKEELGIDIDKSELEFIEEKKSINIEGEIVNKHFNNMFVTHKTIDLDDIVLQEDEVQDIKWFDVEDVVNRIKNNYDGITDKANAWTGLLNYLKKRTKIENYDIEY